jgi:uncharacterized membrane protein YvbJ
MGLLKCPSCEQIIDSESKKCFFCGSELNCHSDNTNSNQTTYRNASYFKKKTNKLKILKKTASIIFIFIFIFILLLFIIRYFQ